MRDLDRNPHFDQVKLRTDPCLFIRLWEQELYTALKIVLNNSTHDTAVTVVFYLNTVQITALGDIFK